MVAIELVVRSIHEPDLDANSLAVSQEQVIARLRPGQIADPTILSGSPLTVNPNSIKDLHTLMTIVGGHVEYCAVGSESLWPTS
ncbi:MAG: hypothetical protein GTO63_22235 [Anaerolineae bacterium]|nr:hypothetical protein [Anaerolineae bacterium]NIN97500.1 hypothetical protein [Anaerolineae bacterium]NIQ80429.1 hypothetical protein [Anaerolineae bacterium]